MSKNLKTYLFIFVLLLTIMACNFSSLGGDADAPADANAPVGDGDTVPAASSTEGASPTSGGEDSPSAPTNTDGAETVFIPGGVFQMGSKDGDPLADDDEIPLHEVNVSGFYLYTHPVTNEMYAACVEDMGCMEIDVLGSGPTTNYPDPDAADHPVVGVDWPMARDYCSWAGGRLPTEAEWEYAARGEESLTYPWGEDTPTCDYVNMFGCQVPPNTLPVGSLALSNSPFDVWDMSGNVWEWVHDWYAENYYSFTPSDNPLGPAVPQNPNNPLKVVKGGGLYSEPDQMRAAARHGINSARSYDDVGFRCVALSELDLPEGYADTDRHERIPPDDPDEGGERAEDPPFEGGGGWWGPGRASCPNEEGDIYLAITAGSDPPSTWSLSMGGVEFDCGYHEVAEQIACIGPAPENYLEDGPEFGVEFCADNDFFPWCQRTTVTRPDDCPEDVEVPLRHSISLECPVDGVFDIVFGFEPIITWDIVQLGGIDLDCHLVDLNHLACTAPDIPDGDHYEFYLHGTSPGGEVEYEWTPWAPVLEDCPVDWADYTVRTACYDTYEPFLDIHHPETEVVESASVGGEELECGHPWAHITTCRLPEGVIPDEVVEFEFCYASGPCFTEEVTVLDCSSGADEISYSLDTLCWPPETPAVEVRYWDTTAELAEVVVGDTVVDCDPAGVDDYICSGLPGSAGDPWSIDICFNDGTCINDTITIPDCDLPLLEPVDPWVLVDVECLSEVDLYIVIDTFIDEPISSYSLSGIAGASCSLTPPPAGRWGCAAPIPAAPSPLAFCVTPAGGAEICSPFHDFPARAPASCAEAPEVMTCSDYTNQPDCDADPDCAWDWKAEVCQEASP